MLLSKTAVANTASLLALTAFAFFNSACNSIKMPETHAVDITLTRAWRGLESGPAKFNLTVHAQGEPHKTGGSFFSPIVTVPTELTLSSTDGAKLAYFAPKDINHTFQTIQIPNRGRDCTRDVDTFDGHNDDGTRIEGTVTSEYAVHYTEGRSLNAWMLRAELDLSDSSGPLGHISATEYVDW